jgi:hypothetical protein
LAGRIILWDLASSTRLQEIKLVDHIERIAFAPDGRHLAIGNDNGTIFILRIRDIATSDRSE